MKSIFIILVMLFGAMGATAGTIAGPDNAPVTIEEFSDFECPYCARGSDRMAEVLKNYPGKVKLVFRNLPLPFHKNAEVAARAFTAVWLQNPTLAYSYQEKIFSSQGRLVKEGLDYLLELGKSMGLDVERMKLDMNSSEVDKILAEDKAAANVNNFRGTPSFLINDKAITGAMPYEEFKKVIDHELSK